MRLNQIVEASYKGIESAISSRDKAVKTNIAKYLGFDKPLVLYAKGTFASVYKHPTDNNKLIKVTAHKNDIRNTLKAQKLNSKNIVKLYPWEDNKLYKEIPELKSWAMIVEKITGSPMEYTSSEFFILAYNGDFDRAKDWLAAGGSKQQLNILAYHDKNNDIEQSKLADLFVALFKLQRIGVELSDFDQNIIDYGDRYVIVDLGF